MIPYLYTSRSFLFLCLLGRRCAKSLRFKSNRDEISQDCSSSIHALIDGVRFLVWRHTGTFKIEGMTSARRSLLIASPPSACDVIGSLYALQFLIHSTFVRGRPAIAKGRHS